MNTKTQFDDFDPFRASPEDTAADRRLRGALLQATRAEAGSTSALENVVLEQWRQAHAALDPALAGRAGRLSLLSGGTWRWSGAGLLVLSALALALWAGNNRSDSALDELMQVDALSQMAIDEM